MIGLVVGKYGLKFLWFRLKSPIQWPKISFLGVCPPWMCGYTCRSNADPCTWRFKCSIVAFT